MTDDELKEYRKRLKRLFKKYDKIVEAFVVHDSHHAHLVVWTNCVIEAASILDDMKASQEEEDD